MSAEWSAADALVSSDDIVALIGIQGRGLSALQEDDWGWGTGTREKIKRHLDRANELFAALLARPDCPGF